MNVKDASLVHPEKDFKSIGAHGLSRNGTAIQVIVGLKVPKVREQFEECLAKNIQPEEYGTTGETDQKSDEKTSKMSVKGRLYAAQTGDVIPLENVPDDVFSQKVMGEGIAVIPKDTLVTAPAAGEVAVNLKIYAGSVTAGKDCVIEYEK